jgi:asparagine synthetase B (glutamine-hydrolysing)
METLKEKISQFDKLFGTVIKEELAKYPKQDIGLYYSGGIDSSLIDTYYPRFNKISYEDGDHKEDFEKVFPQIMKVVGKPVKSFSPYGWWKLGEEAHRRGLKVVFSGENADELFGGYVRYLPDMLYYQAQKMFPSYKIMFPYSKDVNQIGEEDFSGALQELIDAERKIAHFWGLEIVFPFGDERVVRFAKNLPPEYKIWNFETKIVLRRLLEQRNPVYKHIEKRGLFCSVNEWIGVPEEGYGKKTYLKLQQQILDAI